MKMMALHGFTGNGADFALLTPHLDASLVTPDLVGHGPAEPPARLAEYTMHAETSRLASMMPTAMWVMGYSMGGRTALHLAVHHPERVLGLILIGATPGIVDPTARAARQIADARLADRIRAMPLETFLDEWSQKPIIASQRRIDTTHRAEMLARRRRSHPEGLANSLIGMGAGAMPPVWSALPSLSIPVLLLTGEADDKFTRIAVQMQERLPDATHRIVQGAGHCAHLEQPARASAHINRFLSR
ncbi:MAG: 2-succinyl-6-hydroxy-2,4-cyclohexadiene-1-carboxylate synthase [Myxococcota bacterium]